MLKKIVGHDCRYLKLAFVLSLYVFVFFTLGEHKDQIAKELRELSSLRDFWVVAIQLNILVVLLTFVNWGLESLKWRVLTRKIHDSTFWGALKEVVSGITVGFLLPRSAGEFIGRSLWMNSKKRLISVGPLLLSQASQVFVTLLFGMMGLTYFVRLNPEIDGYAYFLASFFMLAVIIFFIVLSKTRFRIFTKNKYLRRFRGLFVALRYLGPKEFIISFIISAARYIVFLTQFVLLLVAFGAKGPIMVLVSAACVSFLAKSIGPSLNFIVDFGFRSGVTLVVFSFTTESLGVVFLASTILWMYNILLPTLTGSLLILRKRRVA